MGSQKPSKITFIHTDSTFRWFDALNFRQTPVIIEISRSLKSTQVPHTYSVTQPLPSHVYLSRCGQSKTAEFHVYTHGLDISVVLCSQLPPHSGNHRDIPESSPHRYPTRILSHNHCHRMCIGRDVGSQKPLKITFIHTDSTCQWFYALHFRQTPAIIEISRTQVHTGTPHIFCHTTTAIACVSVKMWPVKNRKMSLLHPRTRHFSGLMLSTSVKLRQSYRYPGLKFTQVPHTYSVTQPLPSRVYLSRCGQSKAAQFHV